MSIRSFVTFSLVEFLHGEKRKTEGGGTRELCLSVFVKDKEDKRSPSSVMRRVSLYN